MIQVTQTYLPSINEYTSILRRAWKKKWVTNRGELVLELEAKLKTLFDIPFITITNNGTIPLQIAIKLLADKGGEIITTPFSYVATTSAIVWECCTPVFVDIDPIYLTIDESKIEEAITEKTSAILATHVFGNSCNIEVIQSIAKKYGLKVIYDAAHCFGVNYKGKSIFSYGDLSVCSFHATKIFHTGEGGAMFTTDKELYNQFYYTHNFGHNGPLDYFGLGINAKISELQAALGLSLLPHLNEIFRQRKSIVELYNEELSNTHLQRLNIRDGVDWNYSYYPIILRSEEELLEVNKELNKNAIYPRRYFYPSLNKLPYLFLQKMNHSEDIAPRILCLPLYAGLTEAQVLTIIKIIKKTIKK